LQFPVETFLEELGYTIYKRTKERLVTNPFHILVSLKRKRTPFRLKVFTKLIRLFYKSPIGGFRGLPHLSYSSNTLL